MNLFSRKCRTGAQSQWEPCGGAAAWQRATECPLRTDRPTHLAAPRPCTPWGSRRVRGGTGLPDSQRSQEKFWRGASTMKSPTMGRKGASEPSPCTPIRRQALSLFPAPREGHAAHSKQHREWACGDLHRRPLLALETPRARLPRVRISVPTRGHTSSWAHLPPGAGRDQLSTFPICSENQSRLVPPGWQPSSRHSQTPTARRGSGNQPCSQGRRPKDPSSTQTASPAVLPHCTAGRGAAETHGARRSHTEKAPH